MIKTTAEQLADQVRLLKKNASHPVDLQRAKRLTFDLLWYGIELKPRVFNGKSFMNDKVATQMILPENLWSFLMTLKGEPGYLAFCQTADNGAIEARFSPEHNCVHLTITEHKNSTATASLKYRLSQDAVKRLTDFFAHILGEKLVLTSAAMEQVRLSPAPPSQPCFGLDYQRASA